MRRHWHAGLRTAPGTAGTDRWVVCLAVAMVLIPPLWGDCYISLQYHGPFSLKSFCTLFRTQPGGVEDPADLLAFDRCGREISAAGGEALQLVVDDVGGVVTLLQRGSRCSWLLARLAGEIFLAGRLGRRPPGGAVLGRLCLVLDRVRRRRERRVLRAAPHAVLQLGDLGFHQLYLTLLGGNSCTELLVRCNQVRPVLRHARNSGTSAPTSRIPRSAPLLSLHRCSSKRAARARRHTEAVGP